MRTVEVAALPPARRQALLSRLVTAHPIAMTTTVDAAGGLAVAPLCHCLPAGGGEPVIGLTIGSVRDAVEESALTWTHLRESGEFVANLSAVGLAEHLRSLTVRPAPRSGDPAPRSGHPAAAGGAVGWAAGRATVPSRFVAPPSLAGAAAHLECRVRHTVERAGGALGGGWIVLAEVVAIRAEEELLSGAAPVPRVPAAGRTGFTWFLAPDDGSVVEHGHGGPRQLGAGPAAGRV